MKAEDFINESSISQINTPETGGEWAIKVDDVVKLMEQYAQHSAQDRYDEAMKYFDECIKEAKVSGENYAFCFNFIISERANICAKASGLDTPNNEKG